MPYWHRAVLDVVFPTGTYSRRQAVNVGSNVFALNPHYTFTLVPFEKLELSSRLHYLWNSVNHEPFVGLGAKTTQPGQAFFANYAASYEVVNAVRIGVNGYALQQLTPHRLNGRGLADSRERVFGIGPGVKVGTRLAVYVNAYFEAGARNRPQGTEVVFRLTGAF